MDNFVMNIRTEKWQAWTIVSIDGRLDLKFVGEFRKALEALGDGVSPKIALDFSQVSHLDSSALTLLLNFQNRLKKKNGCIVLFGANEHNMDVITTVGFGSVVPTYLTRGDFERSVADTRS